MRMKTTIVKATSSKLNAIIKCHSLYLRVDIKFHLLNERFRIEMVVHFVFLTSCRHYVLISLTLFTLKRFSGYKDKDKAEAILTILRS